MSPVAGDRTAGSRLSRNCHGTGAKGYGFATPGSDGTDLGLKSPGSCLSLGGEISRDQHYFMQTLRTGQCEPDERAALVND